MKQTWRLVTFFGIPMKHKPTMVSRHQNQVFILGKYEIPNKKIVSEMEETYASLFTQYYESVIRDSKAAAPSTGFLFRHYFKKSGIYTKTPLGINAMYLVRKEISQTRIQLINNKVY